MKLLEYKQFSDTEEEKSLNKKKVIAMSMIVVLILMAIVMGVIYRANPNFRRFMDDYVLFKNVDERDLAYINIESGKDIYTCAFYNYVVVLENNKLTLYNSSGKEVQSFEVNINSPIFAIKDNYLVIAEKNRQKFYLIKDKRLLWEKNIEGQISRININENGYVSVIVGGTSYKSVITTYSEEGQEIFKTFLSNTVATDVDISKDNKFLSFCEMDLSGTLIETKVKTISIDKAKQDPANAIIYTYELPVNSLVTNVEYHDKDILICICDNEIYALKNGSMSVLKDYSNENVSFVGIDLDKSYFELSEDKFGINNQNSNLEIHNTTNTNSYSYMIQGIAKDVCARGGVLAVNLGTEAYFLNENGWLIKRYSSSQEIKGIVFSNNIAGIIYRNKIVFLSL